MLFKEILDNFDYIDGLVSNCSIDVVRFQHLNFLTAPEFEKHAKVFEKLFYYNLGLHQNMETDNFDKSDIEKMCTFIEEINSIKQEAPTLNKAEIHNWYLDSQFKTKRKCIYPWRGAQIGADGVVYPCYKIYYPLGDLHEKRFYGIMKIM